MADRWMSMIKNTQVDHQLELTNSNQEDRSFRMVINLDFFLKCQELPSMKLLVVI